MSKRTRYVWALTESRSVVGIGALCPGDVLPVGVPPLTLAAWLESGMISEVKPKRDHKPKKRTPSKTHKPAKSGPSE